MKNKFKYILLVVGVAFIIFGALIPVMFKQNDGSENLDKFDYNKIFGNYRVRISIASQKEYEIDSAFITLKNSYNEYEIIHKTINSPTVVSKQFENEFIYTFSIQLSLNELSSFEIEEVTLETSIGQRKTIKKDDYSIITKNSWTTPVMIITIIIGSTMVIGASLIFINPLIKKNFVNSIKNKERKNNPNIDSMSDDEIIKKYGDGEDEPFDDVVENEELLEDDEELIEDDSSDEEEDNFDEFESLE